MPSPLINKLTLSEYQALVAGIPKYCPNAIFTVAGQTLTAAEAVTFISALLATVTAVVTAKTGVVDAKLAEEKALSQSGVIVKGIRQNIALMFSNSTTTLAEFEIAPKKPRTPLSTAARAAADAKAKATREARGTTSKKQKDGISGGVVGVTITPVKSGTAAASTAPTSTETGAATSSTASTGTVTVGPASTGTAATGPAATSTGTVTAGPVTTGTAATPNGSSSAASSTPHP